MSLKELYHNKWVRFGFWAVLYILWVIWLGNYWWLFGLIPIFDGHITRKVKWLFWKKDYKEGEKRNALLDWLDAIIFAVVVVTFINTFFFQAFKIPSSSMESSLYTGDHLFVSKLAYGPKMPQTPLTIPFTHNVIGSKESYSTLIQSDYKRLKGFGKVEEGDYVVFGFPHGDTVFVREPAADYYSVIRTYGRDYAYKMYGDVKVRPSDKKDHYVKRCVAVAGDTLEIRNGQVYVNSVPQEVWPGVQNTYQVVTTGQRINPVNLDNLGINASELWYDQKLPGYPAMPLTAEMLSKVEAFSNVVSVTQNIDVWPADYPDSEKTIFPFSADYRCTKRDIYLELSAVVIKLIAVCQRILQLAVCVQREQRLINEAHHLHGIIVRVCLCRVKVIHLTNEEPIDLCAKVLLTTGRRASDEHPCRCHNGCQHQKQS